MIAGLAALAVSCGVVAAFVGIAALIRGLDLPAPVSPVLVTALAVGGVLLATRTSVAAFSGLTAPLHHAFGPAVVALAAGVHDNRRALRAAGRPFAAAVVIGTVAGIASALALARLLGLGPLLVAATLTRTASAPFVVLVQARAGGPTALATGIGVATGVIGALVLPPLLGRLGIRDRAALGTAVGVAAHLVGTVAIGRRDALAGVFASAALVGAGVLVGLAVPPLWPWLIG